MQIQMLELAPLRNHFQGVVEKNCRIGGAREFYLKPNNEEIGILGTLKCTRELIAFFVKGGLQATIDHANKEIKDDDVMLVAFLAGVVNRSYSVEILIGEIMRVRYKSIDPNVSLHAVTTDTQISFVDRNHAMNAMNLLSKHSQK